MAVRFHGAVVGKWSEITGNAYAIPYRNDQRALLPLDVIKNYVDSLIHYAADHPDARFHIARFGCESDAHTDARVRVQIEQFSSETNAHSDEAMARLFKKAPLNCQLPGVWSSVLDEKQPARLLVFDPGAYLRDPEWQSRIETYLALNAPLWDVPSVEMVSVGNARAIVATDITAKALKLKHRVFGPDEVYYGRNAALAAEYKAIWYATHMLSISDFDQTGEPQQIRVMSSAAHAGLAVDHIDAAND